MRIALYGPGRAGTAVSLAARRGGHEIVAVAARRQDAAAEGAALLRSTALGADEPFPECDVLLVATRDDAIAAVAAALLDRVDEIDAAVHLSGLTPVNALEALAAQGIHVGSFHPLQTLPEPEAGAKRLAGAWVGVTAGEPLRTRLFEFARSLPGHPFDLADQAKPLYHAAAAAAANFSLAPLVLAEELFEEAGVPFAAARPLVEAVVANAFELGPLAALTGPIARGDRGTVAAQLEAVRESAPQWEAPFAAFVEEVARIAGRSEEFGNLTS